MALPSETVAIPVVKGQDTSTDQRLLQAPSLLEAVNTQFSGGGAKKRLGHTSLLVRNERGVELSPDGGDWVYGIGHGGERTTFSNYLWGQDSKLGKLKGVFSRDNETVLWDGFRLVSYSPSQLDSQAPASAVVSGQATFVSLESKTVAKVSQAQLLPEVAENALTRIVTWIDDTTLRCGIYDLATEAKLVQRNLAATQPDYVRAFTLGHWMHVAVRDADDDLVKLFSISSQDPNSVAFRSYGPATHFDLYKVNETEALLARSHGDRVTIAWVSETGTGSQHTGTPITFNTEDPTLVSVASNRLGEIGLAYCTPSANTIGLAVWDSEGALLDSGTLSASGVRKLTLAPKWQEMINGGIPWDIYWEDEDGVHQVMATWKTIDAGPQVQFGTPTTRYHLYLASRAWGVGDRSFVWTGYDSDVQASWFLLDEGLLPTGKLSFGAANVDGLGANSLHGINFSGSDYTTCHLGLTYKLRVAPDDSAKALADVYTEPTIQLVKLDFLPELHSAQAGRTTYIAGAQLWAYDGAEVVEAGFHLGPEPEYEQQTGGALTALGTYSYRVDLCHRNEQNEEVRSLSLLSDSMELTTGNQGFKLTIPTVLTRRRNSYFLIYRNAMSSGTPLVNWWLLNSRDPSSPDYLENDLSLDTVTYTDLGEVDDEEIQTREFHPASDTWVQPISAPACTLVASGRDRLWVAGGELPPGIVAPSRLFDSGEAPSFNPYLNILVDRSAERITALGFMGEVGAIFRENSVYLLDSDGPDNNAQGFWNPPRLALSDSGAVSQQAVARITPGLIFLSPSGFRILGPGGALTPLVEMDRASQDFTPVGSLVSEQNSEVRFYGADSTLVFNYLYGTWATWTCTGVGVTKFSGRAMLAREDGYLWIETPGLYQDAENTYSQRIRTSWLHAGNLGDFYRVRWVQGIGRYADPANPEHNLRLELYYDERDFWEERVEWSLPDSDTNQDTWGAEAWGSGVWGDTSAQISNLEDLTWDWERRPARQKCGWISISLEDVNTPGPGFELSAFALTLARKQGFNKLVSHGGTDTVR